VRHDHLQRTSADDEVDHQRCAVERVAVEDGVAIGVDVSLVDQFRDVGVHGELRRIDRTATHEQAELLRAARVAKEGVVHSTLRLHTRTVAIAALPVAGLRPPSRVAGRRATGGPMTGGDRRVSPLGGPPA
jgi:hypothetical protein